jgi:hypothetical protein
LTRATSSSACRTPSSCGRAGATASSAAMASGSRHTSAAGAARRALAAGLVRRPPPPRHALQCSGAPAMFLPPF